MGIECKVYPQGWGFCLFTFNICAEALSYYNIKVDKDKKQDILTYLQNSIGIDNNIAHFSLFGSQDLISVFKRTPYYNNPNENDRHSVIENIAKWADDISEFRSDKKFLHNQLKTASLKIWEKHIIVPKESKDKIKEILHNLITVNGTDAKDIFFKAPRLYNYTHTTMVPLFPEPEVIEERLKRKADSNDIFAFYFLRIDPRILPLCNKAYSKAYSIILDKIDEKSVIAIFGGMGLFQIILLLKCSSFKELAEIRFSLQNDTKLYSKELKREYTVISITSTLISIPQMADTANIGFNIFVKLHSGFHGTRIWQALKVIAESLEIESNIITTGDHQGMYHLLITILPKQEYQKILSFIEILKCGCKFIADITTIVRYEDEKKKEIIND